MTPRRTIGMVLIALTLLVGACASSSDDDIQPAAAAQPEQAGSEQQTSAADEPTEPATAVPNDGAPTVNDEFASPIAAALGFDPDDVLEANNAYIRAAEELVRACMAEAGFDYVPTDPGFAPSFERQLELEQTISTQQFVEQYGYGIATLFELNYQAEGVLAFVEQLLGPPPTEARSSAEQHAYELALNGETVQDLDAEQLQEQAFEITGGPAAPGSCRQVGYDGADFRQGEIFDGLQSLLGEELEALGERIENDPRVREVRASWQTCMAGQGYAYEDSDEIRNELNERATSIGERLQTSPEALEIFGRAIDANLSAMDRLARTEFLESAGAFQGFAMVPGLQAELDDLIDFELAVAAHDAECTDEAVLLEARLEIEHAFVEEHAETLALVVRGAAG